MNAKIIVNNSLTDERIFDNLENKTCVITGGTRGLGEATAKLFAKLGTRVLITGRDEERGLRIQSNSKGITFHRADLEDRKDVIDLVNWLDKNFGSVDVLISNAARNSRYDILNVESEEWDRMLSLLLTAPFLLSRWAAGRMIAEKKKGKIIIISAIQAKSPLERSIAYATCKGGLISMVRSMAVDSGPLRDPGDCGFARPLLHQGRTDAGGSRFEGRVGPRPDGQAVGDGEAARVPCERQQLVHDGQHDCG